MTEHLPGQSDLFDTNPLLNIRVKLGRRCACGADTLCVVGAPSKTHAALLACPHCNRNAGWLSKDAASFITSVIEKFGRPTEPIEVRRGST
jgi:hypothetical protein